MGRPRLTAEEKAAKKAAKSVNAPPDAHATATAPAGSGAKQSLWKFESPARTLTVHHPDGRVIRFNGHLYQTSDPALAEFLKTKTKGIRLLEVFSLDAAGNVSNRHKRSNDTPWKVCATSLEWDFETRRVQYATRAEAEAFIAALGEEASHYTVEFIEG